MTPNHLRRGLAARAAAGPQPVAAASGPAQPLATLPAALDDAGPDANAAVEEWRRLGA